MTSLQSEMEQFFLWMGEEKKHLVATVKLLKTCQKDLFFPLQPTLNQSLV